MLQYNRPILHALTNLLGSFLWILFVLYFSLLRLAPHIPPFHPEGEEQRHTAGRECKDEHLPQRHGVCFPWRTQRLRDNSERLQVRGACFHDIGSGGGCAEGNLRAKLGE